MVRLVCTAVVLIAALTFGMPHMTLADPPKEDDRVKRLEKRVADLEKEVSELRAQLKLPPKPALDNKLVGSWAGDGKSDLVGVRLELDGTCTLSRITGDGERHVYKGKYEVVGKTVGLNSLTCPTDRKRESYGFEVVSVGEKELVVNWYEVKVRLERQ